MSAQNQIGGQLPGQQLPGQQQVTGNYFPQFARLPVELQIMIFQQALRRPSVHVVMVKRHKKENETKWSLDFFPMPKKNDPSGFRLAHTLTQVNAVAADAVRLAMAAFGSAVLPFRNLVGIADGAEDLLVLEFTHHKYCSYGYFHQATQFANARGPGEFDETRVAAQVKYFQKVAITYSSRHDTAMSLRSVFRCSLTNDDRHVNLRACPVEIFGLLNCFQSLKEFYIILLPNQDVHGKRLVQQYARNFFALTAEERRKRNLVVFYDQARALIELTPDLMYYPAQGGVPGAAISHPYGHSLFHFDLYYDTVQIFTELKGAFLHTRMGNRPYPYRLSEQARKNLVMKVLIPTDGNDY